jgi:hypothetical protein
VSSGKARVVTMQTDFSSADRRPSTLDQAEIDLAATWRRVIRQYPFLDSAAPLKSEVQYRIYEGLLRRCRPIAKLLELGIYRCGSAILWHEALGARVTALDLDPPPEVFPNIRRYLHECGAENEIFLHFNTSQSDGAALRRMVRDDLGGELDAVIDDASHLYEPTKRSFEILFGLLKPGGAYFIEDWSAASRPDFGYSERPLDDVLKELIGEWRDGALPIESMSIEQGIALILKSSNEDLRQVPRISMRHHRQMSRPAGRNLLDNPSFEGEARGWIAQPRVGARYATEQDSTGRTGVARLELRATAEPLQEYGALRQHVAQVEPRNPHVVSVDYRYQFVSAVDPTRSVGMVVYCLNKSGKVIPGGTFVNWGWAETAEWATRHLPFEPPPGTAVAIVEFRISVNGTMWISQPALTQVPAQPT